MRKIALLIVPLLILGLVSVSADDEAFKTDESVSVAPMIEFGAHSHLTFGVDLTTNATGFTNTTDVDLKVTLIPKGTIDSGMMMDTDHLYAYIELKDFTWGVTSADHSGKTTAPGITTKLIMGAFSITAESKPTIDVDFVDPKDDDEAGDPGFPDFTPDVATEYKGSGGLTLGYKIDPVTLSLGVLSANDWTANKAEDKDKLECHFHGDDPSTTDKAETQDHVYACKADVTDDGGVGDKDGLNDENAYAFIGTIKLDIGDNATLDAAVAYGHEYDSKPIGIGAKAEFKLVDGDVVPHIAFDGQIPEDDSGIPWDVGGGIKWNLSADDKSTFATELMMHAPATGNSNLDLSATLTEGDGDDGALEGLGATLRVRLHDLTGDAGTWTTNVKGSYLVEGIKPYFDISFSNADNADTAFKAGLELSMIDHLVTTLQYKSKNITGDSPDKGEVTAALKISY